MYALSTDSQFAFVLAEVLALSNNFGANTGEVLRAASQIISGDFESFYSEFNFLAQQMEAMAASTRSVVASRDAYFRAASYYRAADFFIHHNESDPRIYALWTSQLTAFGKAIALLPNPGQKITVQAANFTVPVYFYPADNIGGSGGGNTSSRRPTVVSCTGYDASQEETWHAVGREVTARGWNFVTYEGPGQPTVRRDQGLGFIPNWWDVVEPVLDYLDTRDDVDGARVALQGLSFGAILTVRAAAGLADPRRIAAVVVIDGLVSMQQVLRHNFPAELIGYFDAANETAFNEYIMALYDSGIAPSSFKWVVDQGLFSFATGSYYDWFQQLGEFTIDGYAQNISVPIFVGGGDDDTQAGVQQAPDAAAMMGSEATFHLFRAEVGAGEHCQLGAESQLALASLDWLADIFDGDSGNSDCL